MNGLPPVNPLGSGFPDLGRIAGAAGTDAPKGSFAGALKDAIQRVNDLQLQSDQELQDFLTGEGNDVHKSVLAAQRADMAFQMLLAVRNKVIDAYQEIMRIQV